MMGISPTLNIPQARFLAMPHKFKAYVAGFGSGKTWVGCGGICKGFWEFPKINQGYFAPTYPQIRDIFYPTVEEVAFDWGLNVKINESNKEVHFYEGKIYRGTTICRSMEKPQTIVGFKIGNALIDELDVMPAVKAQMAWRKIIARMRYNVPGLRNGIDVTTTPEGFKFVYQQFVKAIRDKPELATLYGLTQASTFDNAKNLPDDYIPSLLSSYPEELIKAYLKGQFTNLTSGTIYHQFDRRLNNCNDEEQPGEPLFLGMDFNVGKMAAIVHVKREGLPRAVRELVNLDGVVTALCLHFDDMAQAKVTIIDTLVHYLDARNFPEGNSTADSSQCFKQVFFIDSKTTEDNEVVEFKLSSPMDLQGLVIPTRQISAICTWACRNQYRTGNGCSYNGSRMFDLKGNPVTDPSQDKCSGLLADCKARFGTDEQLDFGGFPGASLLRR